MFDQPVGDNFAGPGGVQQGHFPRRQFDALAALADLGMAAALHDQEAVPVVLMIDAGAFARDQSGIGADLRHLEAGVVAQADFTDEQRRVQRLAGVEATANPL